MQLVPNDNPKLFPANLNPLKEPNSSNFQLWVDAYDLVNCEKAKGGNLWLVSSIGTYASSKHSAIYNKQN